MSEFLGVVETLDHLRDTGVFIKNNDDVMQILDDMRSGGDVFMELGNEMLGMARLDVTVDIIELRDRILMVSKAFSLSNIRILEKVLVINKPHRK